MKQKKNLRLALFQPDIPQNAGSILRLAACLGIAADIIEPCGFPFSHKKFKRAGMDYLSKVDFARHQSWTAFQSTRSENSGRLVLLTTHASLSYLDYNFAPGDTLLVGSEGAGVPSFIHDEVSERLVIPMASGMRSLNVAIAAAMAAGEALRQLTSHA